MSSSNARERYYVAFSKNNMRHWLLMYGGRNWKHFNINSVGVHLIQLIAINGLAYTAVVFTLILYAGK